MRCSECGRLSASFAGLINGHAALRAKQLAQPPRRGARWDRLMESALRDSSESMRDARSKLLKHEATHTATLVS